MKNFDVNSLQVLDKQSQACIKGGLDAGLELSLTVDVSVSPEKIQASIQDENKGFSSLIR